jgi:hypothetical protein
MEVVIFVSMRFIKLDEQRLSKLKAVEHGLRSAIYLRPNTKKQREPHYVSQLQVH